MSGNFVLFLVFLYVSAHAGGVAFSRDGGSDFAQGRLAMSPVADAMELEIDGGANYTIVYGGAVFVFAESMDDGGYLIGRDEYSVGEQPADGYVVTEVMAGRVITVPISPALRRSYSTGDMLVSQPFAKLLAQTEINAVEARQDFFSRLPVVGGLSGTFEWAGDVINAIKTFATLDYDAYRIPGDVGVIWSLFKLVIHLGAVWLIARSFIPFLRS